MNVYLDNSATTMPYKEALEAYVYASENVWANPSSLHSAGLEAEKLFRASKQTVSKILSCDEKEVFFTSGGTESDNTAILGYARANRKKGNRIICTSVEHPAVLEAVSLLEGEGFDVVYTGVTSEGDLELASFEKALTPDTILVCAMHVNNEVGSIFPIEKLKPIMKVKSPKAALFCDAVQSFGKLVIKPEKLGIDMLSASSHKLHGPKGTGLLYIKKGLNIKPLIVGGHQQMNMRSGTENTASVYAFSKACEISYKNLTEKQEHIKNLKEHLKNRIFSEMENVYLNGSDRCIENILNISFPGVRSEILLHSLEAHGIFVSSGSACSSNKPSPSKTLTEMGKDRNLIDSALRFSFSEFNTIEQIDYTADKLKEEVCRIRKYVRR